MVCNDELDGVRVQLVECAIFLTRGEPSACLRNRTILPQRPDVTDMICACHAVQLTPDACQQPGHPAEMTVPTQYRLVDRSRLLNSNQFDNKGLPSISARKVFAGIVHDSQDEEFVGRLDAECMKFELSPHTAVVPNLLVIHDDVHLVTTFASQINK